MGGNTGLIPLEFVLTNVLLAGFSDRALCDRVLNGTCLLDEADIEVRPEALPSALLDCRVSLPKLKKYCTPDAWSLLMASVAVKKKNVLWICGLRKEKDDGALKMVCCDRCLEWFHWYDMLDYSYECHCFLLPEKY
ncbi:hypothetical protein V5799_000228 [Amblyomma americanum]|uniref:Secreted protein n=1 Tax=Amblyomma americanum TaxID=6943 RepID=A0AAQ4D3N0_AMBAM